MWLVIRAMRRPWTVVVLALTILLASMMSIRRAPADIFPDLGVPVIYVVQPYAGMSPSQMEAQLTGYYEYHFLYIAGIEHIESQSIQGMAMLKLYFHPGTDIAQSMAQVTAMAFRATSFMPAGTLPPFIVRFDAGSIPVGQLVFSSDTRSDAEIQDQALFKVRPLLATLPGVSAPPPSGGKVRMIEVYVDPQKLRAYHLSPDDVAQQLAKSNLTLPAGNVRVGDKATIADTNAMVKDVKELGDVPLRSGNGPTVFVRDIGRVEDSSDVVYNIALVNGRRTVYMPLTKRADASTLDVVANIKHALPAMRAQLPPDIKLDMVFDQSVYVSRSIHGLVFEGILGALLTSLAVILFLRNVRSALIVILTIPLSVLAAIVGLRLAGQTINIMTLGGLALAVGILVDEATVAIENIDTHLARGAPPARAVLDAMREVMAPRFLAMLSVIAVFIPALFMVGIGRALFPPLAMAVAFAMIASYLLSSSLVPVLATWLLRPRAPHAGRQPIRDGYGRLASRLVRGRWLAAPLYVALVAPIVWFVAGGLPTQLFPRSDNGQMQLRIRAPSGTRLERTEEIVRSIDEAIRAESGNHVELTLANIGNPPWTYPVNGVYVWNAGPQEALLMVSLKPGAPSVPVLEDRLRARLHREMPDVHVSFEAADIVSQVLDFGAPTPIDVSVTGGKLADDRAFAEKLRAAMEKEHRLRDVQIRQALDYPTLDVTIDRERAGQLGLTVDRIGKSVVSATSSSVLVTPNFWTNPATGVAYRVAMRIPENQIQSANDLLDLPVMTDASANTLLRDVASVTPGTTPGEVDHYNSQRTISIVANVAGDDFGAAGADVRRAIASVGPPPRGVTVAVHGQTEQLRLAVDSLVTGLAIAIVVVLFLLVAAFQSPRDAFVIILIVPAVLAGVALALALTGQTLNVQSLMGAIMSIGVSIANGLLLVTFARERRVAGDDKATAIAHAARARLRPIVMTSLAMIAGMIPMAMGIGSSGGEATALGTAVIGGLAASTLASLLFLPPLYALVARGGAYRPPSLDPDDPQRTAHA
ncbi:MAG TPA: efflux RND transporter permease subunit [Kofleriaceae bacterium]|nr:efflux RND transporter permease subunit [Kofleriaceae bacterium]